MGSDLESTTFGGMDKIMVNGKGGCLHREYCEIEVFGWGMA